MATMDERMTILTMVQEGKISPEEAAQLLEAVGAGKPSQKRTTAPDGSDQASVLFGQAHKPRWLRVRVTDTDTDRTRVNVRLPISMISMGLKMGSKFAPQIEGLDTNSLMSIIEAGEVGQIVDVFDEDDGEHVEVFLE